MNPEQLRRLQKAYDFLYDKAASPAPFTVQEMIDATDWQKSSVTTYIAKQWYDFLLRMGVATYKVKYDFRRLSFDEFLNLASQKRKVFSKYRRIEYGRVVSYEFLIPLTRETELRRSLDDLFYIDTIRRRLEELERTDIYSWVEKDDQESEETYLTRVCDAVAQRFGGYSISHVGGRFRASDVKSRQEAAEMLANDRRYLIDETTAVVRFIIPIRASRRVNERAAGTFSFQEIGDSEALVSELDLIRAFFFNLFAETVVRVVQGEDEIWLVEDTGVSRRLYVWEKA
jgi:hypothetical protein